MSHYKHNLRDLEFALFEVLGRDQVLGTGPFDEVDAETAREMLAEVARLATEDLAPSLLDSDRNPPVFDPATHTVRLPESFRRSYQAYVDSEFWRADVPVELGGTAIPPSLRWAIAELVLGSNPAVHMYSSGFSFAKVVHTLGTDDQRRAGRSHGGPALGRHDGPDRAGRRLGRGRRTRQSRAAARRDVARHGRQALHHVRRERRPRVDRPPRAGPS
jgi:alkylation response protein AidB-like acyl-CoA dehydrogenase